MATEAQLRANRQNAKKCTGPKTEAGKAISRRNSMVHGLAGTGVVLPPEMEAEVEARAADWAEALGPEDAVEEDLIKQAALAIVRVEWAQRAGIAALARRIRHAERDWDVADQARVDAMGFRVHDHVVDTDAATRAGRELMRAASGCRWLIEEWRVIDATVVEAGAADADQDGRFHSLLGETLYSGRLGPRAVAMHGLNARMSRDPEAARLLKAAPGDRPADWQDRLRAIDGPKARLRGEFRILVAAEVARLEDLESLHLAELDGPDRAEAGLRASFDASSDLPAQRYETAGLRAMHKCLDQLLKLRKDAASTGRTSQPRDTSPHLPPGPFGSAADETSDDPSGLAEPPIRVETNPAPARPTTAVEPPLPVETNSTPEWPADVVEVPASVEAEPAPEPAIPVETNPAVNPVPAQPCQPSHLEPVPNSWASADLKARRDQLQVARDQFRVPQMVDGSTMIPQPRDRSRNP